MNWTLIIVALCLLSVRADEDLDTVKKLLADLKADVQLDLEALDIAWENHKKNKQQVINTLSFSTSEQKSECFQKEEEVQSKKQDIQVTHDFIAWMQKRQTLNAQRLNVLEQNRCQASNNYVHDLKNYKIALALVKFLRQQLDVLEQNSTSAQKQEFLQKVSRFIQKYQTGKLLTMVEEIQMNEDGSFALPNVEGEYDLKESVLTSTRGNRRSNKILLQQAQTTVLSDDDKADSAVVLIPGQCDDSINTVVVVQNDDGKGSSDDDINVRFTSGGRATTSTGKSSGGHGGKQHPQPTPPHHDPTVEPETIESVGEATYFDGEEGEDGGVSEQSEESNGEDVTDEGDDVVETEEDDGEFAVDYYEEDSENGEIDDEESTSENGEHGENGEDTSVKGEEGSSSDHHDDSTGGTTTGSHPVSAKSEPANDEEDLSDIRKVLDAIEKHTKKSLETEQEDEVRSSMIYIDFKLHVELENQFFTKQIAGEQSNLIKLQNQLTNRVAVARQCNARLKQITIAYQISQNDFNDAYQHYLELRKQKEEEVATFEDVYRIYTNQVV